MATHELKCLDVYFDAIQDGRKRFEWRYNRGFQEGDTIILHRINDKGRYNGQVLIVNVTYVLSGVMNIPQNWCILSIVLEKPEVRFPTNTCYRCGITRAYHKKTRDGCSVWGTHYRTHLWTIRRKKEAEG